MSIYVSETSCRQMLLIGWSILLCMYMPIKIYLPVHPVLRHTKGGVHVWSALSADLLKFEEGQSWVAPWWGSSAVWREEDGAQGVEASSSCSPVHLVWGGGGGLHVGGRWGEGGKVLLTLHQPRSHLATDSPVTTYDWLQEQQVLHLS